ncbi:MAG: MBL fold metallo-hydrolase [Pseudomonadales bacterium]|nr:MBL fold metallo-hydrolase [Pseudomonadales bacterium]
MKLRATLLGIVLMGQSALAADDRFAGVEVKTQQLTDHVYMLTGAGGNIGVSFGPDGLLMIDDQFAPMADKIRKAIGDIGAASPVWLLNTHYHGDHTGGNENFGASSIIMAHDNVRVRLLDGEPPTAAQGLPVITFNDEASVHFNNEDIRLIHMPAGHTDGDSYVYFTLSDVLHMGDHFFKDRFPYVDLDAGGSVEGVMLGVQKALAMISKNTQIIPGHGSLANTEDLISYLDMLNQTSLIVKTAIDSGKSVEEIVEEGLGATWTTWGSGFISEERWIRTLYRNYTEQA